VQHVLAILAPYAPPAYPPHTRNAPAAAAMAATFANPEPCLPRGSLMEDLKQNLDHDTNFEATTIEVNGLNTTKSV